MDINTTHIRKGVDQNLNLILTLKLSRLYGIHGTYSCKTTEKYKKSAFKKFASKSKARANLILS